MAAGFILAALIAPARCEEPRSARDGAVRAIPVTAFAARLEQHARKARLVFGLTGKISFDAFPVTNPERIVVDLPEVAFLADPAAGRPRERAGEQGELVKSFRFGLFAPGRSRVVIDLARPAKIARAAVEEAPEGARLAIELEEQSAESFQAAARERLRAQPQAPAPPAPPAARASEDGAKPIVVIDPGHGGVDVGAAGLNGEQEKTIVLDFARTLKAALETSGRFRVLLTREADVFVPLDERMRFARQNKAALFLSIHADTLGEPYVEGATVYTLSARASDQEAAKIAEKENFADQAAGLEAANAAEGVGDILLDLARRETRAYSRLFADTLAGQWRTASALNKNPRRSAGFVVLKAPDVPSVLLELGYLSSKRDLARLTSPEWRERAAEAAAKAVADFFAQRDQLGEAPSRAMAGRPH